jgi:hypothetical protein
MLIVSVPDLRARALDQLATSIEPLAGVIAQRTGRRSDDPAVWSLTGALAGVSIVATLAAHTARTRATSSCSTHGSRTSKPGSRSEASR